MTKWKYNEERTGDIREDHTYLVKIGPKLWSDDFIAKPDVDLSGYADCASELIKEHIDERIKNEEIKCEYLWKHEEPKNDYTIKAYKKCEIDVNVIDEGEYGHRIEITADENDFHRNDVLDDIFKWLQKDKNDETIQEILDQQMCEAMGYPNGWFCHFNGKQDYDAIIKEGYCLDKFGEAVNIEDASPEDLTAHIKETSKPKHYERKFLLSVIKGA